MYNTKLKINTGDLVQDIFLTKSIGLACKVEKGFYKTNKHNRCKSLYKDPNIFMEDGVDIMKQARITVLWQNGTTEIIPESCLERLKKT